MKDKDGWRMTPCNCPNRDALDAALAAAIKRRASVEQTLWDMALGKQPLPDRDKLRELAKHLGVPGSPPPQSPDDLDAERWRTFVGLPYARRAAWACNLSLVPVLTSWIDSATKAQKDNPDEGPA